MNYWITVLTLLIACSIATAGENPSGDIASGTEWTVRHISFEGGSPRITLSGEIAIPRRNGSTVPAVLLISGNGPHTREQTISGCPTFRMISEYLVSGGIAVMSVDARGYGFSTGPDEMQTTTADRAADALASLKILKSQPEIDPSWVGVVGHSEGAMIAMILADDPKFLSFAILLGAPGERCSRIWIQQKLSSLAGKGATQPTLDAVRASFERFVDQAAPGFSSDAAYYEAGKDVLHAHGVKEEEISDAFVDKILSDLRTPHMKYFLGWDPARYLPNVRVPVFAIWGERDDQVPPARNASLFQQAAAKNPGITVRVLPNEDHFFLTRAGHKPGARHEYGRMHVSPALLAQTAEWIESVAKR
jgi:pimeloyl-ACP methyl ester carboxylesterase